MSKVSPTEDQFSTFFSLDECPKVTNVPIAVDPVDNDVNICHINSIESYTKGNQAGS